MQRVISSDEEMLKFANLMMAQCDAEHDSERIANLVQKIADARHRSMYHQFNQELGDKIATLLRRIGNTFYGGDWMLPAVIAMHHSNLFGDNLNKLRSTMSYIGSASDEDAARDYITDELNVEYCNGCDEWEYGDHMHNIYDSDETRCRSCISNNYTYSSYYSSYVYYEYATEAIDEHGNFVTIHNEDDDFVYNDDDDKYYHRNYNPQPRVFGEYHSSKRNQKPIKDDWSTMKHRWLGVELEVELRDSSGDRVDKARHLNDIINAGEVGSKVFFERDGSLNNGIEIISQPMSLPMHHELWQWLNNRSAVSGLRSHNTTTCGLHVHVNRDALSQIQIARIVTFINDPNNEDLIRAIARRYAEGYCRIKEKKLDDAHFSTDRYEAVNITGSNTIEFRIFKGSMKYESVVAAIEFANSMVDFSTKFVKAEELSTSNYLSFINEDLYKETTYLRPYINNRLELA